VNCKDKAQYQEMPMAVRKALSAKPMGNIIPKAVVTSADGEKSIKGYSYKQLKGDRAAVSGKDDKSVMFLMPDGKSIEYPLEKLSKESREKVSDL